jgi:hypothetical protein
MVLALTLPPLYSSSSSFVVNFPSPSELEQTDRSANLPEMIPRPSVEVLRELLFSDRFLRGVGEMISFRGQPDDPLPSLEELKSRLELNLIASGSSPFPVVTITYWGRDPRSTAEIAKVISNVFNDMANDLWKDHSSRISDSLNRRSDRLFDQLADKERALREFESLKGPGSMEYLSPEAQNPPAGSSARELLTNTLKEYYALKTEHAALKAMVEMEEEKAQTDGTKGQETKRVEGGSGIESLAEHLAKLQAQLDGMKENLSGQEPGQRKAQATRTASRIIPGLTEYGADHSPSERAAATEAGIRELEGILGDLRHQIQLEIQEKSLHDHLKHEYDLARDAYLQARDRIEGVHLAMTLNAGWPVLTPLHDPSQPVQPVSPNRGKIILLSLLTALLISVGTELVLKFRDHTIRRPEDIPKHLGLEFMGSIPPCQKTFHPPQRESGAQ